MKRRKLMNQLMVETCKQQKFSKTRVGWFTPVMISLSLSTSEIELR